MKRIFFLLIFLFVSSVGSLEPNHFPLQSKKIQTLASQVVSGAVYLGTGAAFLSVSLLARMAWTASYFSPWHATLGNECLILSHLTGSAAHYAFSQIGKKTFYQPFASWEENSKSLALIPAATEDQQNLLGFLERRFLAKCAGFYPFIVNHVAPIFGISVQTHPETQSTYARDPRRTASNTYLERVEKWKEVLPQPWSYPLVLTRPANLQEYFPFYFTLTSQADLANVPRKINSPVVLDLSEILKEESEETWLQAWETFQAAIPKTCHSHVLCVQQVERDGVGGVRLLPFTSQSPQEIEKGYRYLLEWISFFGLTANRIELDRLLLPARPLTAMKGSLNMTLSKLEREVHLKELERKWQLTHPQKTLMFCGALSILEGLLEKVSDETWGEVMSCPTKGVLAERAFDRIENKLTEILQEDPKTRFFDIATELEKVHAEITVLLEIFSPFAATDFPAIYHEVLSTTPEELRPLTSYSIHASGMTSMAGVLQAVQKVQGRAPYILFGENTYYECVTIGDHVTHCIPVEEATDKDWQEVDLLLAQFNPALKRIYLVPTEYKVEPIADMLRKAFAARSGKPLTLALDCTIDYIDSPRVGVLLEDFQKEIETGLLNVVCYRSGLKFDLFGMDNYCGAPFYMIHNKAAHWAPFDALLDDPALVTDSLSVNWFCLAYKHAAPYLEQYRKHIFENTRAVLDKIPPRLFQEGSPFRIVPFDHETDLSFFDIKISGPLHTIRGSTLAGGLLYLKCMEKGFPIFYRRSIGFYHSNFAMLFSEESATIRLTLGIDSDEVPLFIEIFNLMDTMNGSPTELLLEKI
ncbi:hypothetical protein [Simkania sp.]|uniref:hypothetical protein n=1 Tax=Simkania sp. TaxID=34094 RepID=UPI003B52C9D5